MDIKYEVYVDDEDLPIRGNVMGSGDEKVDREAEKWVIDQLNAGNEYAWCWVRVTASARGRMGTASCGACSCESRADLEKCIVKDLKDEATHELLVKLALDDLLDGTEETPAYLGEE